MSADFFLTEVRYKAGKEFIKMAAKYGARLVRSKKHNIFRDAAGRQITGPKTTSDFRAIKNFEAELKGRGFVNQETVAKVKDSLVKGSKETVLKPTVKTPVNRQTTFKDFTRRYQPNVQGPKRSELQVQADHILRTIQNKRKMITKAQLDSLKISQKEKDKLIAQGLVSEAVSKLFPAVVKATARQLFKSKGLVSKVKRALPSQQVKQIKLPRTTTGFETARGSRYSFSIKPGQFAKTQRTAVNDPTHPTKAGLKQKSDWTLFTTPNAAFDMKTKWMGGASRKDFYKGFPAATNPRKGNAAVEVWNDYEGKGRAMHNSNPITKLRTRGRGNLSMYPQDRKDLAQRVRRALRNEPNKETLRREIRRGEDQSLTNLYRYRNNPQDPKTLERVLRQQKKGLA